MTKFTESEKAVEEKFIVTYQNELYDITTFMLKHPGGVNTLGGYNQKSIDEKFQSIEHSPAAKYLLKDYKVRAPLNNNEFDESMEHLVDWNTALLPQISNLGDKYFDWVNKPVDRRMRLYEHPVMEMLSKTPWYLPLIFWIPVIIYLIFNEAQKIDVVDRFVFFHLISGIIMWTLLEYTLHRFLFHVNVGKSSNWATFHFMIHGLHHKVPFDENRLVFPPVAAAVLATIIYQPIYLINFIFGDDLYNPRLLFAGGLIGYLCYDMIHYYIHHGSPRNQYFYHLKRYHYNHHFVNHDKGFGISSPLWDVLFRTRIYLKKLKYILKW